MFNNIYAYVNQHPSIVYKQVTKFLFDHLLK